MKKRRKSQTGNVHVRHFDDKQVVFGKLSGQISVGKVRAIGFEWL